MSTRLNARAGLRVARWARVALATALALAALPLRAARADVWDLAANDDDGPQFQNALAHGVEQVHDLAADGGVPDQDWFLVLVRPFASYEAVVDGTGGQTNLDIDDIELLAADGQQVLQQAGVADGIVGLRWTTGSTDVGPDQINFIRVAGAACGSSCGTPDQYRIRLRETTYAVPRFNNRNGQFTILTLATTSSISCTAFLHFFTEDGTRLNTVIRKLIGPAQQTLDLASLPHLGGQSGWITIAHGCGYGGLSGKAVSLEPATGFAFDTPVVARPR